VKILVVTKGHPFAQAAFFEMFETMEDIAWTHVEQPAAVALFSAAAARPFDALVMYDMPGMLFNNGKTRLQTEFVPHPPELERGMAELLDAGKPLIFLHHAIAGWPTWVEYEKIIGGRFHFRSTATRIDDGFRHDTTHHLRAAVEHPITRGLGEGFDIEDELYLYTIDEEDKIPLLRSGYEFDASNFSSTEEAGRSGKFTNTGWAHPKGSNLIAWVKNAGNSPVTYIQAGHGPTAFANPSYRRLLSNAIRWSISPGAREWARGRNLGQAK
jgi:type 1 glutamine amidotransferase